MNYKEYALAAIEQGTIDENELSLAMLKYLSSEQMCDCLRHNEMLCPILPDVEIALWSALSQSAERGMLSYREIHIINNYRHHETTEQSGGFVTVVVYAPDESEPGRYDGFEVVTVAGNRHKVGDIVG